MESVIEEAQRVNLPKTCTTLQLILTSIGQTGRSCTVKYNEFMDEKENAVPLRCTDGLLK